MCVFSWSDSTTWQHMRTVNRYSETWRRRVKILRCNLIDSERLIHFDVYAMWLLDFLKSYLLRELCLSVIFQSNETSILYSSNHLFPFNKSEKHVWCFIVKPSYCWSKEQLSVLAPHGWATLWWPHSGGHLIECYLGDTWLLQLIYSSNPFNGLLCFTSYHVKIMDFVSEECF